jgi:hypothetical protein
VVRNGQCVDEEWKKLTVKASVGVSITAIINPDSGPAVTAGSKYDYNICAKFLSDNGVDMLGYIRTKKSRLRSDGSGNWEYFGLQPLDLVTRNLTLWKEQFKAIPRFKGIFVDEFSSLWQPELNQHYTSVVKLVRDAGTSIGRSWIVVANPGTMPNSQLAEIVDIAVIYEDVAGNFLHLPGCTPAANCLCKEGYASGPYCKSEPISGEVAKVKASVSSGKAKAAVLVHGADKSLFKQIVTASANQSVTYLYVTERMLNQNPWSSVTLNWDLLIQEIQRVNGV